MELTGKGFERIRKSWSESEWSIEKVKTGQFKNSRSKLLGVAG